MFPKAKILSPNSNLGASQTVNVVISDNGCNQSSPNLLKNEGTECANHLNPYENLSPDSGTVSYSVREVNLDEEDVTKLNDKDKSDTLNFLKLVLNAYMNNPLKFNGYIICTVPVVEKMIETLTGCDDCSVITTDPEINCCAS